MLILALLLEFVEMWMALETIEIEMGDIRRMG
jgi:hypothetical protein